MRHHFAALFLSCLGATAVRALPPPLEVERNLAPWPGDVSGPAEGALAVPVDAAAAGFVHGPELVLRRSPSVGSRGFGALGVDAVAPLGPLSLQAGWSLDRLPHPRARSGRFGLSVALGDGVRVGASWQRLQPPNAGGALNAFDLGLALRPHPVLSVSLGGESLGAPVWPGRSLAAHRGLRLGVGLRPLAGSPTLTLGLDTRLRVTAAGKLPDTRASLDVVPWGRGLHLLVAWQRGPSGQAGWVGVRVDALNFGLGGAGRFDADPRAGRRADRIALVARLQAQPDATSLPRPHRRLQLEADGLLRAPPRGIFGRTPAVSTLAAQLGALARDPATELDEVLLDVGPLDVGLASVEELRRSLWALRHRGVRVTARLTHGGSKEYFLATAADRIEMDPSGSLDLTGFSLKRRYYAAALAKVGVRFEAVGVGRYKSGPDGLTRSVPRPEEGEVQQERVDTAYATLLDALTLERGLAEEGAHAALAEGLLGAVQARGYGLVDAVAPQVEPAYGQVQELARGAPLQAFAPPSARWGQLPKIAVVPIVGVMQDAEAAGTSRALAAIGIGQGPGSDAHAVARRLAAAAADPAVVGIVLRIDSPGGDVFAAERVWRAVRQAAQHKPLVASLGDVAASGGYYAAVAAPVIFAERNTLTGSIGIYRLKPELSGLLASAGVQREGRQAGEHAGWDDVEAPWTDADRARICRELRGYYDAFVARVAAGRHRPVQDIERLAQGRVYTGEAATAAGLVDRTGGLAEAVAYLRERAQLAPGAAIEFDVPDAATEILGWARRQLQSAVPLTTAAAAPDLLGSLRGAAMQLREIGRLPLALELGADGLD